MKCGCLFFTLFTLCNFQPGHSPVDSRGGQLQIAGVVVGNWGANTHGGGNRWGRQSHIGPPQVTSVGPRRYSCNVQSCISLFQFLRNNGN